MGDSSEFSPQHGLCAFRVPAPRPSSPRIASRLPQACACNGSTSDKDQSPAPGSAAASESGFVRVTPLTFQFLFDAVENAVDELRGLLGAEPPRDLDGFVDDDRLRSFLIQQELLRREAEQIAIDGRHSIQPPVFSVT